ncbi:hypothetical protein OTU49_013841 [Cherax quadricarinatus]|uniref:Protein kinase domain-containing protein n=1 Tax=Cherax quadricarinatus TaxID=27406 RepID=A0AAW0VRJ8_CHEQU
MAKGFKHSGRKAIGHLKQLCRDTGTKILTVSNVKTLKKGAKTTLLGEGCAGRCWRVLSAKHDLVIKKFIGTDPYGDLLKETKSLVRVKDIKGTQFLVGVEIQDCLLLTTYDGLPLYEYYNQDLLNQDNILDIVESLCQTVKQLDSHGLSHNDIKSDNICVKDTKHGPKTSLIDFGNVTEKNMILYRQPLTKKQRKYLDWVAPEVRESKPATSTSDAYSIAKLFQEQRDALEMTLPKPMEKWILECQKKNPVERPGVQDLIDLIQTEKRKRKADMTRDDEDDQPSKKRTRHEDEY